MNKWFKEVFEFDEGKSEELIDKRKEIVSDAQSIEGRVLLVDLMEESVNSSGLRREIMGLIGKGTNNEAVEGMLYTLLLISGESLTEEVFKEVNAEYLKDKAEY